MSVTMACCIGPFLLRGLQSCFSWRSSIECRIEELPDELLLHILTFLPIKAAVRTSILSSRWRFLCTSIPSVNFHDADFPKKSITTTSGASASGPPDATSEIFFTVVSQFLLNAHNVPLHSFTLNVRLKNTSEASEVRDWIRHAFARKKVKEFSLKASAWCDGKQWHRLVLGSSDDCGSVESLKLSGCGFVSRRRSVAKFWNLKTLSLDNNDIVVKRYSLNIMLGLCPCLESLSLDRFDCSAEEETKIFAPPRLNNLKIICSAFVNLEIVAPCLRSFEFDCNSRFCDKSSVDKLVVPTTDDLCVNVLKTCTCAILALPKQNDTDDRHPLRKLESIVVRPCWKPLHLEDIASVLPTSSSCLQRLCIDHTKGCITYPELESSHILRYLRSATLYSFQGTEDEIELVKRICNGAKSLELMTITAENQGNSSSRIARKEVMRLQKLYPQVNRRFSLNEPIRERGREILNDSELQH